MQPECCQTDYSSDCTRISAFIRVCRNSEWKSCHGRGCWVCPIGNQWEETQGWLQSGIRSLQITSGNKCSKEAAGTSHGHWEETMKFSSSVGHDSEPESWRALDPFWLWGAKWWGKIGKGEAISGHTACRVAWNTFMLRNILVLYSNLMLIVEYGLYSLPSLLLDWLSVWEHLFVGTCDFLKINLFLFSFLNLFLVKMYQF